MTRFLNIQPSLSEMELPLRFIFALNIMQINKERNHSTVNPNTKARYCFIEFFMLDDHKALKK